MKKFLVALIGAFVLALVIGAGSGAQAASKYGISANTTKSIHSLSSDKYVRVVVKNDNSYITGANLEQQKKNSAGKWVSTGYFSPNPLDPEQKVNDDWYMQYFTTGTYRFKVDVDIYDTKGNWVKTAGSFYTGEVVITK